MASALDQGGAEDLDCADFASQGDAQAVLNADPSDPHRLDGDSDGITCETLPSGGRTSTGIGGAPAGSINEIGSSQSSSANQAVQNAPVSCANYDAWEWAQLVYETAPEQYAALDPDGDGLVCPELPRGVGFAPAIWTDRIPEDVERAEVFRVIDGDTLEVLIDGVTNRVRIYRADTPETQNEQHCGGPEATAFAEYALSFNDTPGVVYLEKDENEVDRFGRELAYVWFEVAGQPYLLNHVLITNGWAEDVDYGDRKYDEQFQQAAAFAQEHELGVYALCGGFDVEVPPTPTPAPLPPTPTPAPALPQPAPPQPDPPSGNCDPSYPGVCIPPISVSGDLDCGDVAARRFTVVPPDPHGFDGDGDGVGCE